MEQNITIDATNMSQLVREAFMDCLFKDGMASYGLSVTKHVNC